MKSFPWFLAAAAVAAAAYILMKEPGPQYASGSGDVEDAARGVSKWGSKNVLGGAGTDLVGQVKQGLGELTGNDQLANDGALTQAKGRVKKGAGKVAQAAADAIHELNR